LLALTGAGLVVLLMFLLPRLNTSRAAGPRGATPEAELESSSPAQSVELLEPIGIDQAAEAEAEPDTAVAATVAQEKPLEVGESRPKVEGPPLRFQRGGGKPNNTVDHQQARETSRERRKQRREDAAAEERAFGTEKHRTGEDEKFRSRSNPDRERLGKRAGTGGTKQGQLKGKPKGG